MEVSCSCKEDLHMCTKSWTNITKSHRDGLALEKETAQVMSDRHESAVS